MTPQTHLISHPIPSPHLKTSRLQWRPQRNESLCSRQKMVDSHPLECRHKTRFQPWGLCQTVPVPTIEPNELLVKVHSVACVS